MSHRSQAFVAIVFTGALATSVSSSAQSVESTTSLVTMDKVRKAAELLSERAVTDARNLDFPTYRGDAGFLVAEGDSWYDYPLYDVLQNLEGLYNYKVESVAHHGDTLESMVYDADQLAGLALKMDRLSSLKIKPTAILLSGTFAMCACEELSRVPSVARDPTIRTGETSFIQVGKASARWQKDSKILFSPARRETEVGDEEETMTTLILA